MQHKLCACVSSHKMRMSTDFSGQSSNFFREASICCLCIIELYFIVICHHSMVVRVCVCVYFSSCFNVYVVGCNFIFQLYYNFISCRKFVWLPPHKVRWWTLMSNKNLSIYQRECKTEQLNCCVTINVYYYTIIYLWLKKY